MVNYFCFTGLTGGLLLKIIELGLGCTIVGDGFFVGSGCLGRLIIL